MKGYIRRWKGGIYMDLTGWGDKRIWSIVWPVCISFLPIGIAFGVMAQKQNFSPWEVLGFSVIVFAGSAQFIAIAMMSGGFSVFSIVLTTFVVNLRHFLFSSTLAPYFGNTSKKFLCFFAYGITDESFALNIGEFRKKEWTPEQALKVNYILWATWVIATVSGSIAGEWLPLNLDVVAYALTAMFVGLWSFYLSYRPFIVIGFLGGILAVIFFPFVSYKLHLVTAAMTAATIGCLYEIYEKGERNS